MQRFNSLRSRLSGRLFSTLSRKDVANNFVESFIRENHAETLTLCSPGLQKAFPSDVAINRLFKDFTGMYGNVLNLQPVEGESEEIMFKCDTECGILTLAVKVEETSGLVESFEIFDSEAAPTDIYPPYSHEAAVKEITINFGKRDWRLPATLTIPSFATPETPCQAVVVCVHDFGPNDRNGSYGPNNIFRDIAFGLAARGIATFRYDKRTLTYADRCTQSFGALTPEFEVIEDAISAIRQSAELPIVVKDNVYVLGLGQGGYFAPKIVRSVRMSELNEKRTSQMFKEESAISRTTATNNPYLKASANEVPLTDSTEVTAGGDPLAGTGIQSSVRGVILMSTPGRSLEDNYLSQIEHVVETLSAEDPSMTAELSSLLTTTKTQVDNVKRLYADEQIDGTVGLPLSLPGGYWQALKGYRPSVEMSKLLPSVPVLYVQGGRDYTATAKEDLAVWRESCESKTGFEVAVFDKLSKSFVPPVIEEGEVLKGGYAHPREVFSKGFVAQEVVDKLSMWINTKQEQQK